MTKLSTASTRWRASGVCATVILATCLCVACGLTPPSGPIHVEPVGLPALSVGQILGPVASDTDEMRQLKKLPGEPPVRLRRAWVLLQTARTARALRELNQVLFGSPSPTREERAFALYIRGRAWVTKGDRERAAFDFEEARRATADRLLAAQIDGARLRLQPTRARPRRVPAGAVTLARGDWRAEPPRRRTLAPMGDVHRITVHHSAILTRDDSRQAGANTVRAIQRSHIHDNGWADIGYHYVIDRGGRVWDGRSLEWQGAHAGDPRRNRGNIGVCLLGNFVTGRSGQHPSAAQSAALEGLLAVLCRRHGVVGEQIFTHRELRKTQCPGAHLQAVVERFRRGRLQGMAAAQPDE
ncbi:MAG: peptidoglycan recognition family protein [Planctomycetota bacterium]